MKKIFWLILILAIGSTALFSFGKTEEEPTPVDEPKDPIIFSAILSGDLSALKNILQKDPTLDLNIQSDQGETPLTLAASLGNKDIVLLLLNNLANPDITNKMGSTPILAAMDAQKYEAVNALLLWDAKIDVKDSEGETLLLKAVRDNQIQLVKKLLIIDEHVAGKDSTGNNPFHIALSNGNEEIISLLNPSKEDITGLNNLDESPLSIALKSKNLSLLKTLLDNIDISDLTYKEGNLLHYAVGEGNKALVEYILSKSETLLNGKDIQDRLPLDIALARPKSLIHMEIAEILIKAGSHEPGPSDVFYLYQVVKRNRGDIDFGGGSRALHLAAREDHLGAAKLLLKSYPINLDFRDQYGSTPLLYAIKRGHESMSKLLLDNKASLNIQDSNGLGPVHYAIRLDNGISLCDLLIQYEMSFQDQDNLGNTALHIAVQYDLGTEIIQYLINHETDPNVRNQMGNTPLLEAIEKEQKENISILKDHSDIFALNKQHLSPVILSLSMDTDWIDWFFNEDNINSSDFQGNTVLHYAASYPVAELDNEKIRLLLKKGAQPNRRNSAGDSPLHLAVESMYWNNANLLVELGSDLFLKNNENKSPLQKSFERGSEFTLSFLNGETPLLDQKDNQGNSPLLLAIMENYSNIASLLINIGANPNERNYRGITALLLSIEKGDIDTFQLLLNRDADINLGDNQGDSALHYLVKDSTLFNQQLGFMLLDKGLNINLPNNKGQRALHYSIFYNNQNALDFLLLNGADIEAYDNNGFTPLFYAIMKNSLPFYNELKNQGANLKVRDYQGNTLLHGAVIEAIEDDNEPLIKQLIDDGADIYGLNIKGDSALSLALSLGYVVVDRLLVGNAINMQDNSGNTPLHSIIISTKDPEIWRLLVSKGANLNQRNGQGLTPYQLAKSLGYSEELLNLLQP